MRQKTFKAIYARIDPKYREMLDFIVDTTGERLADCLQRIIGNEYQVVRQAQSIKANEKARKQIRR